MGEGSDLKEQVQVSAFRTRAEALRRRATYILGIVGALLVGAAVVFVVAPFITLTDLYPQDVTATTSELTKNIQEIDSGLKQYQYRLRTYDRERVAVLQRFDEALQLSQFPSDCKIPVLTIRMGIQADPGLLMTLSIN